MTQISFEELVAPLDVDVFMKTVKGKKPLVIRATEFKKKFFSDITSWDHISDYLNNSRAVSGFQMITPGGGKRCMEKKGFLNENVHRSWDREPRWDKAIAHDLWRNGHSMILTKASQISPNMNAICKAIEDQFPNSAGDAHFYCSGDKDAATFACHADRDDNFLIHAVGMVHWRVYNVKMKGGVDKTGRMFFEGRSTISAEEEAKQTCIIDAYLGPGDLLYIPAGWFHRAEPEGARVSISVPLLESNREDVLDRNYYHFGENNS